MGDLTKKLIGTRINTALAAVNLKQKDLAKELDVTDNTVSYWCNGSRIPNTEQIIQIARVLNVSSDYLLGLSDVATKNEDVQYICEFTGLSADSVNNLLDINYEKKNYKDSIFEADKTTYKFKQATLFFINCILEDRLSLNAMSISFYEYFKLLSDKSYDPYIQNLAEAFEELQAEQKNKDNNICVVPKSEMMDYRFYSFINQFSETIKNKAKEKSLFFEE